METQEKLAVLARVARLFNQKGITWAVEASLLLYFKGLVDDFHDIDITVQETDIERVKTLLAGLGTLQQRAPSAQYKTKYFLEYTINGVELDIMAGFTIVAHGVEHAFPLHKEDIRDSVTLEGTTIPLQPLETWQACYTLMGRPQKAALIAQALAAE